MRSLEGNLWRYRAYSAVVFTPFMLPVLVVFWRENGLDLYDVFALQGLFAVGVVLLEVPTGMVADRLGKRTSLIASSALGAVAMVIYAMGHGFWVFLLAELIMAAAASLYSGADSALLYDTLERLDRTDEYRRHEGNAKAVQLVSFAVTNLIGGVVGAYSLRGVMWLTAVGPAISLFIALGMVEASPHASTTLREATTGYRQLIADSLRFVGRHRVVQWQIAWIAVLTGSSTWLLWLYQPYMELVGLPMWAWGAAFASFNLFAAACSKVADRVANRAGERGVFWLLAALQVLPLFAMAAFTGLWSWAFIWGHQAVRGIARPVVSARILRYTWADKRSTVLSIAGLAGRLFFAITAVPIGLAAKHLPLTQALAVQGVALALALGALLALREWIPAKYDRVKAHSAPAG